MDFQNNLTIRQLKLLKILGRELNLRRTAELLNTSQPAISRRLAEVESFLGAKLFERTTRKIAVTPLGRSLIWHADRILGDLDQAQSDFQALARGAVGGIEVGVLRGFSPAVLAHTVRLMRLRVPGIDLRFREGLAERHIADLERGRVDLVLTHLQSPRVSKQIVAELLYNETIGLLVSPRHALARKKSVVWDDVAACKWIVPNAGTTVRHIVERMLANRPVHYGRPDLLEVTEPHFAAALARDDKIAVAAMPRRLARWFEAAAGATVCLELEAQGSDFPIYAARLRSRRVSETTNVFLECLHASANAR